MTSDHVTASQGHVSDEDVAPRLPATQPQRPSTPGETDQARLTYNLSDTITSAIRPATGAFSMHASSVGVLSARDGSRLGQSEVKGTREWQTGVADKGVVGKLLTLKLVDTWGDPNYMGLTGIKVCVFCVCLLSFCVTC